MKDLHWFAVAGLFEDFRCHVAWCSACRCEDVEGFFVHDPREAEVGYEEVGVVFGCSEQEVLRFEVAVDDAVVMEVGDSGEGCADEVCGVGFVVTAFSAYSVEEFAAEGQVCDEVDCGYTSAIGIFWKFEGVRLPRLFMVSK